MNNYATIQQKECFLTLIPEVIEDKNLNSLEEKILSIIYHLDNENGCFASNAFFADICKVSIKYISRVINQLVKKGYITSELTYQRFAKRSMRILKSCYKKAEKIIETIGDKMKNNLTPEMQLINSFNRIYKEIYGKDRITSKRDKVNAKALLQENSNIEIYENMFREVLNKKSNIYSLAYFIHGEDYKKLDIIKEESIKTQIPNEQIQYKSCMKISTRTPQSSAGKFIKNYENKQLLLINNPDNDLCIYFYGKLFCMKYFGKELSHSEKEFMKAFEIKYKNPMLLGHTKEIDVQDYQIAKARIYNKMDILNRFQDFCIIYKWENSAS